MPELSEKEHKEALERTVKANYCPICDSAVKAYTNEELIVGLIKHLFENHREIIDTFTNDLPMNLKIIISPLLAMLKKG